MTISSTQAEERLLPCPFCGGRAAVEEIKMGDVSNYSVGCIADELNCMGYQSLTQFARRCEAITAWNTRASPPAGEVVERTTAAEFEEWLAIVRGWSGSAWLADEDVSAAEQSRLKGELYSDLCRLGNHLMAWADEARLALQPGEVPASEQGNG